ASDNRYHAVKWSDVGIADLGTVAPFPNSHALDINSSGLAAGNVDNARTDNSNHAVIFSPTGPTDVGAVLSSPFSGTDGTVLNSDAVKGKSLNDLGHLVGWQGSSNTFDSPYRPFFYDHGTVIDLTPAGFPPSSALVPVSINNADTITGNFRNWIRDS